MYIIPKPTFQTCTLFNVRVTEIACHCPVDRATKHPLPPKNNHVQQTSVTRRTHKHYSKALHKFVTHTKKRTLPLALEARNFTTSYLQEAAAWCRGVQPSPSRARTSSGKGSSSDTREVLPLMAARCRSVLNRSFLRRCVDVYYRKSPPTPHVLYCESRARSALMRIQCRAA